MHVPTFAEKGQLAASITNINCCPVGFWNAPTIQKICKAPFSYELQAISRESDQEIVHIWLWNKSRVKVDVWNMFNVAVGQVESILCAPRIQVEEL